MSIVWGKFEQMKLPSGVKYKHKWFLNELNPIKQLIQMADKQAEDICDVDAIPSRGSHYR